MAQLYRRKGGDILVNTTTAGIQTASTITVLQDGSYVVAWTDFSATGGDTSFSAVRAQRFDADGNKLGGEFLVNTTVSNTQSDPAVTALPSGRFVITWTDGSGTGGDTSGGAIRGQLYEQDGTPVGGEFLVNTQTANGQLSSSVAELAGGGFVVTWQDASMVGGDLSGSGIKAQLFDNSAAKIGGEILVNTVTAGTQSAPTIAALPGGGFVVAWQGPTSASGGSIVGSVRVQMFDSAGAKVGAEQVVNASDAGNFLAPSVAALASGFVVTWSQQDTFDYSVSATYDVHSQLFDASGAKLGGDTIVAGGLGSQSAPDAHALAGGGYIVTWQGAGQGLNFFDVFGQIFDATGSRLGVTFIVNSVTTNNQSSPEVEVMPTGDIVIVWTDGSFTGGDASNTAIMSQILTLSTAAPTDIALSGTTISETAREGTGLATLTTVGTLNSAHSYTIVSDSSGGAFGVSGDKLVVVDNSKLDFEASNQVQLRVRTTDENGNSYEKTLQLTIADTPEAGYAASGGEFPLNTTTQGNQAEPLLTPLASGGWVAMWYDSPLAGGTAAVKARIFDSDGSPLGGELTVKGEAAAALPGGGFVTTWSEYSGPGDLHDVKAQIYDSAGTPVGAEFLVNSALAGEQYSPSVAAVAGGGFVVAFTSTISGREEIDYQLFDASGAKVNVEFVISLHGGTTPEAAGLANGNFVIVWATGGGIMATILTPQAFRVGTEFEVSASGTNMVEPHVIALAGGGFVVTYSRDISSGGVTGIDRLSAQVFDANGNKVGDEILISGGGPTHVGSTDVAALPWGGFVVSWTDQEDGDPATYDAGIRTQIFDATGAKIGAELAVNQIMAGSQIHTDVAVLASGKILVGWSEPDASGLGVKARFLDTSPDEVIHGTPGIDVLNGFDGNDLIFGHESDDQLIGGSGDDGLDGGSGADSMTGGTGDDYYVVDDAGDVVTENADEGTDEVRTSLAGYSLAGTNVENLSATSDAAHEFRGSAVANVLTGGGGNDRLLLHDGGDDTAHGGGGNDVLYFGAALSAGDVADGGDGRDAIVLQGNVTVTLSDTNLIGIESISIQSGANATFGDTVNNFYDFDVTTADGNVLAGQQLIVNAQSLRAGEDFTFDGSAETDGKFLIYGGHGTDNLTGGAGVDVFFFEGARWTAGDHVDGGAGRDSLVISGGSGLTHIEFAADSFVNIESISVNNRYATDPSQKPSYDLVLNNGNVAPGGTLIVNGSSIALGQVVHIDGSGVHGGNLILFGGGGHDVITGGGGADTIIGGGGQDSLAGGAGADIFRYDSVSDSPAGATDLIGDFQSGLDRIDLSRIDANTLAAGDQAFTWIGASAFSGVAGQLRIRDDGSFRYVEGDTNGDGLADFAIAFHQGSAPQVQGDFLL